MNRSRFMSVLGVVLTAAFMLFSGVAAATPTVREAAKATPVPATTVKNVATGLCLDSNTSGDAYTLRCNGGNFQKWTFRGRTVKNVATGLCLDSNTSGNAYTQKCNGGNFQNWKSNGGTLKNVATGLCLDSNTGGRLYTLKCNGGNFQKWSR